MAYECEIQPQIMSIMSNNIMLYDNMIVLTFKQYGIIPWYIKYAHSICFMIKSAMNKKPSSYLQIQNGKSEKNMSLHLKTSTKEICQKGSIVLIFTNKHTNKSICQ